MHLEAIASVIILYFVFIGMKIQLVTIKRRTWFT